MLKKCIVLALGCCCLCATAFGDTIELFVSPEGNDARWYGRSKTPTWNRTDGPFRTIPAALAQARILKRSGHHVSIFLREGTYVLTEPLTLTADDSGVDSNHPFLLAAYKGEKAVVTSETQLFETWTRIPGTNNLWQTWVPYVREGHVFFHQLFANGERKIRARQEGFFRINGTSAEATPNELPVHPGDIKPEWAKSGDTELIALFAWSNFRLFIRDWDSAGNTFTLSETTRGCSLEANARYYIENSPDLVDRPGEWFLDRKTGDLTYCAHPGENPNLEAFTSPHISQLILIKGEPQNPARHIAIKGITFRGTDWSTSPQGYVESQAAVSVSAALEAQWTSGLVVEDCTLAGLGGYAIDLGRGSQRSRIIGNHIHDLGAGGIRVGETSIPGTSADSNHGHLITDNHIHHFGLVYPSAVGVLILHSGTNHLAHNEIDHSFYTAVSVGWTWGYKESPCRENIIEFNHLHHIGQGLLSDMGGVYTLGIQNGTVIRNNLIHDIAAFKYGGWGLYTDEGSTGIILESNVVYRCKHAGFHQHYGMENVLRNNIFACNLENTIMRTRGEQHHMFTLTNNILYKTSGEFFRSTWPSDRFSSDYNVFYDTKTNVANYKFDGKTYEEWSQRGHDHHSIMADPLFVNPAKDDFRLRRASPAWKLGFKKIDLRTVGVRRKK